MSKLYDQSARFILVDNLTKLATPFMVFLCAKLFFGGPWGLFKYYETLMLVLFRLSSMGLDKGIIYFFSRSENESEYLKNFFRSLWMGLGVSFLMILFGFLSFYNILPIPFLSSSEMKIPLWYLALFLGSIPLQLATQFLLQSLINKGSIYPAAFVRNGILAGGVYGLAVLLYFTPYQQYALGIGYGAASLVAFITSGIFFLTKYPNAFRHCWVLPLPPKNILKYSLPIATTEFVMTFAIRFDLLLLAQFGNVKMVEIYAIVVVVANSLRSIRQSFDNILLNLFSDNKNNAFSNKFKIMYNYAVWLVCSYQLPLFIGITMYAKQFLGLIGSAYSEGSLALSIAAFFILLNNFGAYAGTLLMGLGKSIYIPITQGIFFVGSIFLNYLLVPQYLLVGAALATGLSGFMGGSTAFVLACKESKTWLLIGYYFKRFAIGVGFFIPSLGIHYWTNGSYVISLPFYVLGMLGYIFYFKKYHSRLQSGVF